MSVYSAAYTIKQYIEELKTATPTQNKKQETPKTKPKTLERCSKKQFGNTKLGTLEYKFEVHKQKKKASYANLKYQKILHQEKVINCQFENNLQQVFCQMK